MEHAHKKTLHSTYRANPNGLEAKGRRCALRTLCLLKQGGHFLFLLLLALQRALSFSFQIFLASSS